MSGPGAARRWATAPACRPRAGGPVRRGTRALHTGSPLHGPATGGPRWHRPVHRGWAPPRPGSAPVRCPDGRRSPPPGSRGDRARAGSRIAAACAGGRPNRSITGFREVSREQRTQGAAPLPRPAPRRPAACRSPAADRLGRPPGAAAETVPPCSVRSVPPRGAARAGPRAAGCSVQISRLGLAVLETVGDGVRQCLTGGDETPPGGRQGDAGGCAGARLISHRCGRGRECLSSGRRL